MKAEKANYPVTLMARVLKVSRSGFYEWLKRESDTDLWAALSLKIETLWLDSDKVFGARTIHTLLLGDDDFDDVTLYRVRVIMRTLGIFGIQPTAQRL
jgi:hypothetical protein